MIVEYVGYGVVRQFVGRGVNVYFVGFGIAGVEFVVAYRKHTAVSFHNLGYIVT